MIIDVHGHYTTEPQPLLAFRDKQLAGLADPMRRPAISKSDELGITRRSYRIDTAVRSAITRGMR